MTAMKAASGFLVLFSAAALAVCVAQEAAPATTSGPQVVVAPPQITLDAPRVAYKKMPPSASSAPQAAAAESATKSDIQEVTVNAHRLAADPDWEDGKGRMYVNSKPYGDPNDAGELWENRRACADERIPAAKRLANCNMAIWMVKHGASMDNSELATSYVARAVALQQTGDDHGAINDFTTARKLDPQSPRPWLGLGNLYAARSDYPRAFQYFDRAMSIEPDDPVIYDNRGTALEAMGRHEDAIADFSRAIALAPQDTSAHSNRATAYLASKKLDLAIADLNEVIRADPSNGLAYYDRATAYEQRGEIDKAMIDYRETAHRKPSFAPAFAALGRLDSKDDIQSALQELTTAIRLDPRSPALKSRAILFLSLGEPERALPDLDQAITNDASDAIAWADRGVTKSKLGDNSGAIADCTHAIELAPTLANRLNRGNAYANLHRNEEALADFQIALQLDPKSEPALLGRANANYASKRLAASLEDYTRVIDADPHSAIAYFKRGNIHLDRKEFGAAFSDYSDSLAIDPKQPLTLVNRSIAAARLGRRTEAANDQRRALDLDPTILDR